MMDVLLGSNEADKIFLQNAFFTTHIDIYIQSLYSGPFHPNHMISISYLHIGLNRHQEKPHFLHINDIAN